MQNDLDQLTDEKLFFTAQKELHELFWIFDYKKRFESRKETYEEELMTFYVNQYRKYSRLYMTLKISENKHKIMEIIHDCRKTQDEMKEDFKNIIPPKFEQS